MIYILNEFYSIFCNNIEINFLKTIPYELISSGYIAK